MIYQNKTILQLTKCTHNNSKGN